MTTRPDKPESRPDHTRDEYRALFEHMSDVVFFVRVRDGRILQVNPAAESLYGVARERLIGARIYDLIATPDGAPPAPPDATRDNQITAEGTLFESVHRRADGSEIPVEVNARVIESAVEPYIIAVIRDITERKQAERRAEHHATHDSLTGLPNRLLLGDRLESALARARREGVTPAVLFCDVDGFKRINDTLGHARGDEVLSLVAHVLASSVRASDTVARLGGDEFVVLLADAGVPSAAVTVAEKILAALQAYRTNTEGIHAAMASIGIAHFREGDDADSLLKRADSAMYRVKARGGGGYLVAGTYRGK